MRSFTERSSLAIGAVGVVVVSTVVIGALQYQNLPVVNQAKTYSAQFADAGGLLTGATVEVSGYPAGRVSSIELDGATVLVRFSVDKNIRMGRPPRRLSRRKACWARKCLRCSPRAKASWTRPSR